MSWPTPQEYNEAIQNPAICFSDPDLRKGIVELTPIGIPKAMTGAFASVYRVSTENGDWAVRCFLNHRSEQKERYEKISRYVLMDNLEYTVEFHYLEEGIRLKNKWYPILKMNWLNGPTFETYLLKNYQNRDKVKNLKEEFARLAKGLDDAGMAHGDLQHGNMIVLPEDKLRLIDYDAIFVPDLLGKLSLEVGHPNYQHPLRSENNYDTTADNFSCWLIYNSLAMVEIDPKLIDQFSGGDECILFRQKDFLAPESSPLFNTLLNHKSDDIKEMARTILRMLWARPELIPELHHPEELELLPDVKPDEIEVETDNELYWYQSSSEELIETNTQGTRFEKEQNLFFFETSMIKEKHEKSATRLAFFQLLRNRTGEIADRSLKFWAPLTWIEKAITKGDKFFNQNNYHRAAHFYLLGFKEANKRADDAFRKSIRMEVSAKLANSLMEAKNYNLATNYFHIAYKTAKSLQGPGEERAGIFAFLLACNHYLKGDKENALYLFENEESLYPHLKAAILKRSYNSFIYRPEILAMLLDLTDNLKLEPFTNRYTSLTVTTIDFHEKIKNKTSPDLDRRCIKLALYHIEYQKRQDISIPIYETCQSILDTVKLILEKEGKDYKHLPFDNNYFKNMLISANLYETFQKKHPEFLSFWQKILNLKLLDRKEFCQEIISDLELLSEADIFQCLHSCLSNQEDPEFDFKIPLEIAIDRQPDSVYKALVKALFSFGTIDQIVEHWQYLFKNKKAYELKNFEDIVFNSLSLTSILNIIRLIPDDIYDDTRENISQTLLDMGTAEDLKEHIIKLGGVYCTSKSVDFLLKVLEENENILCLKLINDLIDSNCLILCKLACLKSPQKLKDFRDILFPSGSSIDDSIEIIEMFLDLFGFNEARKYLLEKISESSLENCLELLEKACNSPQNTSEIIVMALFQAIPTMEHKYLVSYLINNRHFSVIETLFFNFAKNREFFDLEDLALQISWDKTAPVISSPLEHVKAGEYFEAISRFARIISENDSDFSRFEWEEKKEEMLLEKFGHRLKDR